MLRGREATAQHAFRSSSVLLEEPKRKLALEGVWEMQFIELQLGDLKADYRIGLKSEIVGKKLAQGCSWFCCYSLTKTKTIISRKLVRSLMV